VKPFISQKEAFASAALPVGGRRMADRISWGRRRNACAWWFAGFRVGDFRERIRFAKAGDAVGCFLSPAGAFP
jgi:hypothetical protein